MNADTLTMLCRERDVEANDNFQRQFPPSCNFSKCRLKIRWFCPQPCPDFFLCTGVFACCERCCLSPSLTCTVVGGRRVRPIFAVEDGRRFRHTSGHLEFISMSIGANQFFSVMDAAVLACTFPRPSVVVKDNELYSEMRNVRACFYDVTTRMLCFCTARQLSTDLGSLKISCRQENSPSHIFVFVDTAFCVVACVLLHVCSFVSHPSLRTAQGGIIPLDVV